MTPRDYDPFAMRPPRRVRIDEQMDSPALARSAHVRALRGLARLNRLSRAARIVWPSLRSLAEKPRGGNSGGAAGAVRVLDVATGSGDIPIALAQRARRAGLEFDWHAADLSERALAEAGARAARAGVALTTFVADAVRGPLPGRYDAVICSLFLHHLDPPDAEAALRRMAGAAERLLIVCDLRRTRPGLVLAACVPPIVTRSDVVRHDAVASARAAYTAEEMLAMARGAGLTGATVRAAWPQRMLLTWEHEA